MTSAIHILEQLEVLLLDAFTMAELEMTLERWNRGLAADVPSLAGISPRRYVHDVVRAVWARGLWTREDGLLAKLMDERPNRRPDFETIAQGLQGLVNAAPHQAESSAAVSGTDAVFIEILRIPNFDLLQIVDERLTHSNDPFWRDGAPLFRHLRSSPNADRRLRVAISGSGLTIEAWPNLVSNGQTVSGPRVANAWPTMQTMEYTYCPKGRGVLPGFSLVVARDRISIIGVMDHRSYTFALQFEGQHPLRLSPRTL